MIRKQPITRQPRARSAVAAEMQLINKTLRNHKVNAWVAQNGVTVFPHSHIEVLIDYAQQTIDGIEKRIPEIEDALTRFRKSPVTIIMQRKPVSFQLPLRQKKIMPITTDVLKQVQPHSLLLGKSFGSFGSELETASFEDQPHWLVAGTTGAGKSVALQSMIASMCYATPPSQLRIVLIDLKNKDLRPFVSWPHTLKFVHDPDDAVELIRQVQAEKQNRVDGRSRNSYRLVMVIDEMFQLVDNKEVERMLSDICSQGRSLGVNAILATQHPSEKGGMGVVVSANLPGRMVGKVSKGLGYAATRIAKSGAEELEGKGAFLRINHDSPVRLQTFRFNETDLERIGNLIMQQPATPPPPLHETEMQQPVATADETVQQPVATELVAETEPAQLPPAPLPETPEMEIARRIKHFWLKQ